jgi:hypothetical protein
MWSWYRNSKSYTVWMLPPSEFSIGSTARSAAHCVSAWKATSNCSHGMASHPGQALLAAISE